MPQLDKVTFLSQFFWLCFFYLGFYILILKYFLPKMSRVLKLRKKKLSSSQEGVTSVQQENNKVRWSYDTLITNGFITSRSIFNNSFQRTQQWLQKLVTTTNQTHSQAMNKAYIHSIGQASLSQNLAITQLSTLCANKLFVSYLVKKLSSLAKPKLNSTMINGKKATQPEFSTTKSLKSVRKPELVETFTTEAMKSSTSKSLKKRKKSS
jgi:F0F1-type ATP synthase membrane subunit b/b'